MKVKFIPVHCPKCNSEIKSGEDKGDWTRFFCHKCSCLFTVANSDLEQFYHADEPVIVERPTFNPSSRLE